MTIFLLMIKILLILPNKRLNIHQHHQYFSKNNWKSVSLAPRLKQSKNNKQSFEKLNQDLLIKNKTYGNSFINLSH